jgi:hypothetical protein
MMAVRKDHRAAICLAAKKLPAKPERSAFKPEFAGLNRNATRFTTALWTAAACRRFLGVVAGPSGILQPVSSHHLFQRTAVILSWGVGQRLSW